MFLSVAFQPLPRIHFPIDWSVTGVRLSAHAGVTHHVFILAHIA